MAWRWNAKWRSTRITRTCKRSGNCSITCMGIAKARRSIITATKN
ncbi:hypothetical protein [Lysobacter gummosus]